MNERRTLDNDFSSVRQEMNRLIRRLLSDNEWDDYLNEWLKQHPEVKKIIYIYYVFIKYLFKVSIADSNSKSYRKRKVFLIYYLCFIHLLL